MNAKKIMGAVLVALLALTAFAGVAAAEDKYLGTVFVYEETDLTDGIWNGENGASITVTSGVVYPGAKFVAGNYKNNGNVTYVTYPTATYAIGATIGANTAYLVANGGNVYSGSNLAIKVNASNTGNTVDRVYLTYPNGTAVNTTLTDIQGTNLTDGDKGVYKIQAIFGIDVLVAGAPSNLLLDTVNALTFNVVGAEDATISASVDTVYSGETITLTVKGTPGTKYYFNSSDIEIKDNQLVQITDKVFVMPNVGEASFVATVTATKEAIIPLEYEKSQGVFAAVKGKPEIKITVSAPVVTATLSKPSYFVGENITVTGTATAAQKFTFNISGTNIVEFPLGDDMEAKKNWIANLSIPADKNLDVGTYTIKVIDANKNVVATLPVALKQPFISIAEAPEVVTQNKSATFLITAEATYGVQAYFFGTNYFNVASSTPEQDDEEEDIPGLFNVTIGAGITEKMATGQYFAVFQHPMYDGKFNIMGFKESGNVTLNTEDNATETSTLLFKVKDRQTANAAQALCDALDSQNIDDMYVKYSFFVVSTVDKEIFSISEIPTTVAQGETITITGVATEYEEGTPVTVEMVSTAFAAVPKETVGSAAFILVTTEVAEDGTWEITLDTSDLNVDEYSLKVAVDGIAKESVTVNVVEADEPVNPEQPEEPEQPEQPEEPVAPATPGFGALAALAGLGAVAVLLLRRE